MDTKKKDIKDYLHLYLGCEVWHINPIEPHIVTLTTWRLKDILDGILSYDLHKLILRPLSDMNVDEAEHFAWLCLNSPHAPKEFIAIDKDEIDVELVRNDGGNMLDGDVELYMGVCCRCFDGYISIMCDGRIGISDEKDIPSEQMKPVDDVYGKVLWLLKQGFDLFGLIEAGLALDKTKLNQP